MKLAILHEDGFNIRPRRGQDYALHAELRGAIDQLRGISHNPGGSRVSLLKELLSHIIGTIADITIDSEEERKHMHKVSSLIETLHDALADTPDGPAPDAVVYYIDELRHLLDDFCNKYYRY